VHAGVVPSCDTCNNNRYYVIYSRCKLLQNSLLGGAQSFCVRELSSNRPDFLLILLINKRNKKSGRLTKAQLHHCGLSYMYYVI